MQTFETEDQQVEAIKQWWLANYKKVISIGVIGIGSILGVQYYQQNQQQMAEAASNNYNALVQAAGEDKAEIVNGRTQILKDDYPNSPYAAMAALMQAKILHQQQKMDESMAQLAWVEEHSSDQMITQIAFISKLKLMLDKAQWDQALQDIDSYFSREQKSLFRPVIYEIQGDLLSAKGQKEQAAKAYDEAMAGALLAGGNTELLRMKRNDLGISE